MDMSKTIERSQAIVWWNDLNNIQRYKLMDKWKDEIIEYFERSPSSLTGREIEHLHKLENR